MERSNALQLFINAVSSPPLDWTSAARHKLLNIESEGYEILAIPLLCHLSSSVSK
jgi:hypothetical protein